MFLQCFIGGDCDKITAYQIGKEYTKGIDMTRTRTAPWDYERHHKVDTDCDVPICAKCGGLVIFKSSGDTLCARCGEGRGVYRVPLMSVRAARVSAFARHPELF